MPAITDLFDSDMEDSRNYIDENSLISSASESTEAAGKQTKPAKKSRKRKCVTMPKPKSRVAKASPVPLPDKSTKKVAGAKRKALEEQLEKVEETQTEEVADASGWPAETKPKARGRPIGKSKVGKARNVDSDGEEDVEVDNASMAAKSNHAANKPKNSAPKVVKASKAPVKKPSQAESEEVREELMDIDDEDNELETAATKRQQKPITRVRSESRVRQQPLESAYRRRAGSASDTERGDPNLRRRLGDITRKFENMDTRYRQLKEVGITEANLNVEKIRKQCEATVESSNKLVASLKKELAVAQPLAEDARRIKQELAGHENEVSSLQKTNTDLHSSLAMAQNEIKTLQSKLAAARKASVEPPTKTPASAIKGNHNVASTVPGRALMVNGRSDTEAAQLAQMKLDLYSDLTGLIIRSVKRNEEGDAYDCIQTGRNGTLHFKLFIDLEDSRSASFEETEFLYTPLLDADRDREMIELMPAYLTEDITFARQNAAKFYQRVVDTLTRRIVDE